MIFDLLTFTLIHVVLSLVGIVAGLILVGGLMAGVRFDGWTGVYFVTTVLTNVTGFGFPSGPSCPHTSSGVSHSSFYSSLSQRDTGSTSPGPGAGCSS